MRELAVQAANGIYTASDRQAIQLEVSQLTDEINRIAKTTEFNTKTLLDGTLGALVSTDDITRVRAAVSGNVGKGGNFVLKAVAKTTGQLQVQKTDVFTTQQIADAVGKINYLATWRADATLTTADARRHRQHRHVPGGSCPYGRRRLDRRQQHRDGPAGGQRRGRGRRHRR